MSALALNDVHFRYTQASADTLAALDLEVAAGEAHALLGGSGAGKSTLLNLLSGLLEPSQGEILFNGSAQRPPVSQVFQFPVLYESMSAQENLAFAMNNHGHSQSQTRTRSNELAQLLEFESHGLCNLDKLRVSALSLFQKQLLAIGKALMPPEVSLVLLDEPLTAVQPSAKWSLRRALRSVQDALGVTMIYVTHDQTEALTFADRVSVLHNGRIVQSAAPQALYDTPATEYVAYFIGSPGMNLVPAQIIQGQLQVGPTGVYEGLAARLTDGPVTLGFRPEWAILDAYAEPPTTARTVGFSVQAGRYRTTDIRKGLRHGLIELQIPGLAHDPVLIVAAEPTTKVTSPWLRLLRFALFREGRLLEVVGVE